MKILMVSPNAVDTFWSFKHALKFVGKQAVLPPLGLLTVAAMLPKDWQIKLVDMAVTGLDDRDIQWADYVFIGGMYIQKKFAGQIIGRCKKMGTKIVAGGPLFSLVPEDYADVDHLVLDEAELTLPRFLKDMANGNAAHIYRSEDQWADVSETPIPLWNLIDAKRYGAMCIQYSRGCPFDCDFCDVTARLGHKSRTKSKDQIIAELESLYAIGWRDRVFFVDDNLIGNKAHLKKEILPAIIEWMEKRNRPFSFNTQASINLADDDELMRLMAQAGFNCVFVGIETPSEKSLAECNKVQNKGRDLTECVKKIQRAGLEVQGGFILGFDSDDSSTFETLIKFIQESGIVTAMVGLLNAPIGTKLYDRMVREKRLLYAGSGDNTDLTMNFVPIMNYKELLKGYQKVVCTLYSNKEYYSRVLTFFKDFKPLKSGRDRIDQADIKAFVRTLWRIGVKREGKSYYWKLIFWGLAHPRCFNKMITFIIYGYHFQIMFEQLQPNSARRYSGVKKTALANK